MNFLKQNLRILFFSLCAVLIFNSTPLALATPGTVGTVPSKDHWAWNDAAGWIDFAGAVVDDHELRNNVNSSVGSYVPLFDSSIREISLNCSTGGNCSNIQFKVENDGIGYLSGYAWNDAIGWISFCGGSGNPVPNPCPGNIVYYTAINPNGYFYGYAWNDVIGWISFNCVDIGLCQSIAYDVRTDWRPTSLVGWLESKTFDTNVSGGAQLNSIVWKGTLPQGTAVRFQLATSNNSAGPWSYIGPDGTSNTYYESISANKSIIINYTLHNNQRYFRYKIYLYSDLSKSFTPQVDDVIINWSP